VELRGADFDWDNWAGLLPEQLAAQKAATELLSRDAPPSPLNCLGRGVCRLYRGILAGLRRDHKALDAESGTAACPVVEASLCKTVAVPAEDADADSFTDGATSEQPPTTSFKSLASSAASRRSLEVKYKGPTLQGPHIMVPPGQLVGICGEVWSSLCHGPTDTHVHMHFVSPRMLAVKACIIE
jgi:hypothetical protein